MASVSYTEKLRFKGNSWPQISSSENVTYLEPSIINLLVIFSIDQSIVWSVKCQHLVRNVHYYSFKSKVLTADVFLCPTNSEQSKDIWFWSYMQIFTLEKLEQSTVLDRSFIKIVDLSM